MGIARWCFAEGTAAPTVMMRGMKIYLPDWLHPWFVEVAIVLQVLLILLVAWTVRGLLRRTREAIWVSDEAWSLGGEAKRLIADARRLIA